jgi:threonine dehydrogenase-like Zn-dependent dehydrogenase
MPREIVSLDGRSFRIREYELPPLGPHDVRVRVDFAAPKHGTELHGLTGSPFDHKRWDPVLRMFLPRDDATSAPAKTERNIGNMIVGQVSAVGAEVSRFAVGDRVFGYGPIRDLHQALESRLRPIQGLSDVDAVCVDPAHVAFVAVRDGNIRIGDSVAVFGLGAIGLMAVQIARAGGARRVFAIDLLALRREHALAHGADVAIDPRDGDSALTIKRATGNMGVDVAIEASGSSRALHEAIRCIRQCGTIVHVPWGPKDGAGLHLDEEFHLNRPTLIGSQAWDGWGNPDRSHPLWDHERAYQATIDLFRDRLITGEGVVTPIVDFEHAPHAMIAIRSAPETTIKFGVKVGCILS